MTNRAKANNRGMNWQWIHYQSLLARGIEASRKNLIEKQKWNHQKEINWNNALDSKENIFGKLKIFYGIIFCGNKQILCVYPNTTKNPPNKQT